MAERVVDRNDPDIIIQQIKAGAAFGGGVLAPNIEQIIRKNLSGDITDEEMIQAIKKEHGLK